MTDFETSPTLPRIKAAGVLRVGTTGDYTPFSLKRPDGTYEGADIDMAHDLAATLGVRVVFVPTVWVDLLDDFISRTGVDELMITANIFDHDKRKRSFAIVADVCGLTPRT